MATTPALRSKRWGADRAKLWESTFVRLCQASSDLRILKKYWRTGPTPDWQPCHTGDLGEWGLAAGANRAQSCLFIFKIGDFKFKKGPMKMQKLNQIKPN
jgi:hypothetical protein